MRSYTHEALIRRGDWLAEQELIRRRMLVEEAWRRHGSIYDTTRPRSEVFGPSEVDLPHHQLLSTTQRPQWFWNPNRGTKRAA
jgi:hypothetical protein